MKERFNTMAWRLYAKFKNLKEKALKRQWKLKIFFSPPKENTKASEMATLKEGDFVVLLPKCLLYLKSRISVPVKLVLFTLLSVSMSLLTFPQYFENQLWKKM